MGLCDALIVMMVGFATFYAFVGFDNPNILSYLAALTFISAFTVVFSHLSGLYEFETVAAWPRGMSRMFLVFAALFLISRRAVFRL